jgi:hypothetical protein
MGDILLKTSSRKPGASEITLIDGATVTGYTLLTEPDWGNVVWEVAYGGRRGTQGSQPVAALPENRLVTFSLRIAGSSKDDLLAKLSTIQTWADQCLRYGGRLLWRSKNQTYRQWFEILAGFAAVTPWPRRAEHSNFLDITINLVCAPFLLGDPLDVTDDFSSNRLSEYTVDAGALGNVAVTGGELDAVANFSTENRVVHTEYGYVYGDHQATIKATPGATITSFKAGVLLKRLDAQNYLEVYVDDNGTNSRLRLDKVVAGVRTNLSSTTLGARVVNGQALWVRGRIEGSVVYLEYFNLASFGPAPLNAPTTSASHTLAGGDATTFGSIARGKAGFSWTPQDTAAKLDDFVVDAFWRRNVTLPNRISYVGEIPGDAPSLGEISVTCADAAAWALLAWHNEVNVGVTNPFRIIEAETGTDLTGWTSSADANYSGGNGLKRTVAGAESLGAEFEYAIPTNQPPEDFRRDTIDVEVWARVELASTLVNPRITLSSFSGLYDSGLSYAHEFGQAGRALVKPSSGTSRRFVKLGTLTIPIAFGSFFFRVDASTAAGSTGQFGLDYLLVVPANDRALGPTGKALNTYYPRFLAAAGATRRIRADLSGLAMIAGATYPPVTPGPGLGGSLIELEPGDLALIVKLSTLVPDDPTADTTTETLSHAATVSVAVTPRYRLARPS